VLFFVSHATFLCAVLIGYQSKIESRVLAFFDEIKDKVPLSPKEYVSLKHITMCLTEISVECVEVVDFAVDLRNDKIYVIELNPFGRASSSVPWITVLFTDRRL
jgi:hypothetical protein